MSDARKVAERQRKISVFMLWFGVVQFIFWAVLLALTFFKVGNLEKHFSDVFWVSILSIYANCMTVFCIIPGSWAGIAAADASVNASSAQEDIKDFELDLETLTRDLATLADMDPSAESQELADDIAKRLTGGS